MTFDVPPDDSPMRCPHCERPFRRERLRDLHVGEAHAGSMTAGEEAAFEAARTDESNDLFVYHLKVVAALTLLYGAVVVVYMVVLTL